MDFLGLQTQIINYIQENYSKSLEDIGLENVNYINDFLDLDKYQKNKQLFYDFADFDFTALSNESNSLHTTLKIYLTFKNGKSSVLNDVMMKYAAAFYDMFHKSNDSFGGVVDYGRISNVHFYYAAEANINVKVAEIQIELWNEE